MSSKQITLEALPYACAGEETIVERLGLRLTVEVVADPDMGPPWKEHDGHGPVSEWTLRPKSPGERILCYDGRSRRYYDFAEAVKIARRDGWDAPPYKTGTPGERAVRAVESDLRYLRDWCEDRWTWVGVIVRLRDDSRVVAEDSLWGVESESWKEIALELANALLNAQADEQVERAHWEARDTVTVG